MSIDTDIVVATGFVAKVKAFLAAHHITITLAGVGLGFLLGKIF